MVSVNLKGTGVRPEVTIGPEDGIISFSNALVGETVEKQFEITNVSSFSRTRVKIVAAPVQFSGKV